MAIKEITFEYLNGDVRFRVVCEYGGMIVHPYNWKFSLQRQILKKRFLRKPILVWDDFDWKWCEEQCDTVEKLKKYADQMYHDSVIAPIELIKKAMNITQK